MAKYRIEHRYPCYNGGCIPYDGYFVQKLEKVSLLTNGLTSKDLVIESVLKSYWKY